MTPESQSQNEVQEVLTMYKEGTKLRAIDRLYGKATGWAGHIISRARANDPTISRRYQSVLPGKRGIKRDTTPLTTPEERAKRSIDWKAIDLSRLRVRAS